MKRTIILALLVIMMTGCATQERLQIIGDQEYAPIDKACTTNQECVNFVNNHGGDGSLAKCIDSECAYPVPKPAPKGD